MQRRLMAITITACLLAGSGCSVSDIVFNALGSRHYTGGGETDSDRQQHVRRQIDRWKSYEKFGDAEDVPAQNWNASIR